MDIELPVGWLQRSVQICTDPRPISKLLSAALESMGMRNRLSFCQNNQLSPSHGTQALNRMKTTAGPGQPVSPSQPHTGVLKLWVHPLGIELLQKNNEQKNQSTKNSMHPYAGSENIWISKRLSLTDLEHIIHVSCFQENPTFFSQTYMGKLNPMISVQGYNNCSNVHFYIVLVTFLLRHKIDTCCYHDTSKHFKTLRNHSKNRDGQCSSHLLGTRQVTSSSQHARKTYLLE